MLDLRNCDCMDLMREYPDKFFDLAIVDPPYGIDWMEQIKSPNEKASWKKYEEKNWDKKPPSKKYFDELFRTSKNQIIWGGNYFHLSPTPCYLIWDKIQEFSGATFEMAWTSFKRPCKAFRMARCQAYVGINKIHPTQKPVALYKWLLQNYAKQGDKILDTHLGSGSIAIACHQMGFDLTGSELDADYFQAMLKRIDVETRQQDLFL